MPEYLMVLLMAEVYYKKHKKQQLISDLAKDGYYTLSLNYS